jgi:HPt (histidine-containing phosphotransfer) domain-containing protein
VAAIRCREAAGARRTWVIAVTANALDGQREACLRAGMDDFLSKPIRAGGLAQALARIPRAGSDGAAPENNGATPNSDGAMPKGPVDPALLETLAQSKAVNGENLLARMVKLFTGSGPQLLDEMDRALEKGDTPSAIRSAHKLAGGCSYFGAEELYARCVALETRGREGDFAAIRALAPRIREEYMRVELALGRSVSSMPASL